MWARFAIVTTTVCPTRAWAAGSLGSAEWFFIMVVMVIGGLALSLYLTRRLAKFVDGSWPWFIWFAAFFLFVWKFFFTNW